jgi:hypothetical protein
MIESARRWPTGDTMTTEQPKFPTLEDELLASQLYQAMRKLADGEKVGPTPDAPDMKKPAEAGVTKA